MAFDEVTNLKNEANEFFKTGDVEKATSLCKKAIELCSDNNTLIILHKNQAAYYLKLEKYQDAIKHCDKVLEMSPHDPKALYRRSCALESIEKYEEAYRDAQKALLASPGDAKALTPLLTRLHLVVEERRSKSSKIMDKATRMMKYAFENEDSSKGDGTTTETAFNNIIVLCRERAGIEALLHLGILQKLKTLLDLKQPSKTEMERKISCLRILSEIVKSESEKCKRTLSELGIPFMLNLQDIAYGYKGDKAVREEAMGVVQYFWQVIMDSLSGMVKGGKPNPDMMRENKSHIDSFLTTMAMSINSRTIDAEARDTILQLFTKNIDYQALSWAEQFMDVGGLRKVLEVGAEVPELKIESSMKLTPNTRNLVSVLMSKVYDNMYYDKVREQYVGIVDEFSKELLHNADIENKVRCVSLINALLLGPVDVGNTFIGKPGMLQMILVMANSEEYLQQRVASETIIAAASKKDKAKGIISEGVNILKRLYMSKNDDIKVRALVGLCKLGSSGGTDAAWKPFAEGATLKLAEACRRFLLNPAKDLSIQRWAIEGLSYLTLDAEVKEKLIEDTASIKALLDMSAHANLFGEVLYPIITTLVNLVNAYDKQEIIPELVELAKFAKHHIPEEHEYDDPDFVDKRVETLAKLGVTSCLVNLSKSTESANLYELIGRILNAVAEKQENRGIMVAQGGARELIRIFPIATVKGKRTISQALARLGISQPPQVAFPGQRSCEVVKPLISLLDIECTALQNYEALLALCNLAGDSETLRKRIWDDEGYMKIEHYIYEDHPKLKCASLQCLVNLALSERTVKVFEGNNERVKYLMMLCSPTEDLGDEDKDEIDQMIAAASTLAIVSTNNREICGKIITSVAAAVDTLIWLAANPLIQLQIRGLAIIGNVFDVDKEFAEQLVQSNLLEILLALVSQELEPGASAEDKKNKEDVKKRVEKALASAEKWGLIQKS